MKKTISLFKILFNTTYGLSRLSYKSSKNKTEILKVVGILAVIVFSLSPIIAGYTYYMTVTYDALSSIGQAGAVITMGVVIASILVLFFGFFYIVSTFYFTTDTEHLVAMPLKPSQIIGAKFAVVLISEYITELPLILPPIIVFGIKSGAGILYWVYSILALLTIPILPLCLVSILAIIFMRLINIGKKKDLLTIIGGVVAIFLMLGVQMVIQRAAISGDPQQINNALFSQNGIINVIASNFPPAGWISIGLSQYGNMQGLLFLILFIGVSLAFLLGFGYLGEKLFLGGYLGSTEINARRKKIDEEQLSKEVRTRGKVMAIFWREFKILNRVPVFFINNVLVIILVPVIFLVMYYAIGSNQFREVELLVKNSGSAYLAGLIVTGVTIFSTAMNMTPPTSISREGAQFFISKYIPVSSREQVLGKAFHSLALITAGNILMVASMGYILKLSLVDIIVGFVTAMLSAVPIIEIGLMIDLFRPLLVWDNPQKAVKQNLNGVISMFLNMLWSIGIVVLAAIFIPDHTLMYIIPCAVFIILGVIFYRALMGYAAKRYADIEP